MPTLYTQGGITYDKTEKSRKTKGWSDEGIERFNVLFEKVKQDRKKHPDFIVDWLNLKQAEKISLKNSMISQTKRPTQITTDRSASTISA